ncbi:hypothetical protein G6O69_28410 [Pseudenhygromyxa sp. WMMC2535]|uniref:hypothetical protein n=1 Tax=Pseudenhygromyxa sp. WMMC2535 TaxID=2712867 RepID=UPI00155471F6|nr:hypothetical protein [Pseudenhygromyxa sp. WMMC2535]NVB41789.1 hypothetical protein [Pseudenhygromyxa sp. WMMC2535]
MSSGLHLPIHDPCHEDWDAMHDEGARRFCDMCSKHVHDLSSMTEREARGVLAEESRKGRVCVRYRMGGDGQIRFRRETTEAPSLWRMSLAAAGLAVTMLTGCTDSLPTEIHDDKCTYEVGPWSFEAARGEGTCPAVDEEPAYMGQIEMPATTEPLEQIQQIEQVEPQEPDEVVEMGEAPMVEAPPEPDHAVMGKLDRGPLERQPAIETAPEPVLMGDVAIDPNIGDEEPCDGAKTGVQPEAQVGEAPAPTESGPRRL